MCWSFYGYWRGEGEWKITVDVFRDLGLAFVAALLAIYVLLVVETRSFAMPGLVMLAIPLGAIGDLSGKAQAQRAKQLG